MTLRHRLRRLELWEAATVEELRQVRDILAALRARV